MIIATLATHLPPLLVEVRVQQQPPHHLQAAQRVVGEVAADISVHGSVHHRAVSLGRYLDM